MTNMDPSLEDDDQAIQPLPEDNASPFSPPDDAAKDIPEDTDSAEAYDGVFEEKHGQDTVQGYNPDSGIDKEAI